MASKVHTFDDGSTRTTCLYSQFTVVGEGSGVGVSSENKLQFNSSDVAPVEGRGCY
jgi:hypothetical protein